MIHWDLETFIRAFTLHASWRKPEDMFVAVRQFTKLITEDWGLILYVPSYIAFAFALGVPWLLPRGHTSRLLIVGWAISFLLAIVIYPPSAIRGIMILGWLLILLIVGLIPFGKTRAWVAITLSLVFGFSQLHTLAAIFGTQRRVAEFANPALQLVSEKPLRTFAIDSAAARYVFDFKLPVYAVDWNFLMKPPGAQPDSLTFKASSESWIVSAAVLHHYIPDPYTTIAPINFLGRSFRSLPARPFEIEVID